MTSSSYYYGFYTRNTIPLDLSCEYSSHKLDWQKFVDMNNSMSRIEFWHHILVWLSLFCFSFSLIFGAPQLVLVITSIMIPNNGQIFKYLNFWGLVGNSMFTLLVLITLGLSIGLGADNFKIVSFLKLLVEWKCSDPFSIDTIFPYIIETLTNSNYVKIYIIVWSAILIVLEGVYFWFEFYLWWRGVLKHSQMRDSQMN